MEALVGRHAIDVTTPGSPAEITLDDTEDLLTFEPHHDPTALADHDELHVLAAPSYHHGTSTIVNAGACRTPAGG